MLPLFAHSRHIALPPVFVYGFGAIFGKITAIEPPKISRSISDRVDCPPIRLSCFGIISKEKIDEDWKPSSMFWEVTNRRQDEKTISYAESHDHQLILQHCGVFLADM